MIRGAETSIGTTGGSDTHTHTDSGHASGEHAHSHNVHSDTNHANDAAFVDSGAPSVQNFTLFAIAGHDHPTPVASSTSQSAFADASINISTESNLPPCITAILIHPTSGTKDIPDGASILLDSGVKPTGFSWHDGVETTPDLTDKYIRGVANATTDDGGGSVGSATHQHTDLGHSHPAQAHTHPVFVAPDASLSTAGDTGVGKVKNEMAIDHHKISLAATTVDAGTNTASGSTSSSLSNDPAFIKVRAAKNTSGADKAPTGMICLYKGTLPVTNWDLCDGTGGTLDLNQRFPKITNTTGDIGSTGGFDTHAHVNSFSHTHTTTATNHTHTVSNVGLQNTKKASGTGGTKVFSDASLVHEAGDHDPWTVTTSGFVFGPISIAITSIDSSVPAHVKLAYVKYNPSTGVKVVTTGGAVITSKRVLTG